jgi:hypothetical protein
MSTPITEPAAPTSLLRTIKVVLWAFLGIRKDSETSTDFAQLKPVNVIIVGLLAALTLVLALVGFVNWVIAT